MGSTALASLYPFPRHHASASEWRLALGEQHTRIADQYLDRHQAAVEAGTSYRWVVRAQMAVDGMKFVRIGRKHMTTREWIQEYLNRRIVQPNPTRGGRR